MAPRRIPALPDPPVTSVPFLCLFIKPIAMSRAAPYPLSDSRSSGARLNARSGSDKSKLRGSLPLPAPSIEVPQWRVRPLRSISNFWASPRSR